MQNVKIVIERSNDLFCAYAENVEGVYGAGTTVSAARKSVVAAIRLLKKYNTQYVPQILKEKYRLEFQYAA